MVALGTVSLKGQIEAGHVPSEDHQRRARILSQVSRVAWGTLFQFATDNAPERASALWLAVVASRHAWARLEQAHDLVDGGLELAIDSLYLVYRRILHPDVGRDAVVLEVDPVVMDC
jgi:hypothetical protein